MANLAVLNTFLEVASLSGPLRFWAEAEKETRCALKHRGWQGKRNNLLRALRRDGHRILRHVPLFPRGACPPEVLSHKHPDYLT